MPNLKHQPAPGPALHTPPDGQPPRPPEHESMDELRRDCARMAPHWPVPLPSSPAVSGPPPGRPGTAANRAPRGVLVPASSARLLDGLSEYGPG